MSTPSMKNWPSREEWAKEQRTLYADMEIPHASSVLKLYASEAEIAAAIADLEQRYRELGVQMKIAKVGAGELLRQSGETQAAYTRRWGALSREEKDCAGDPEYLRGRRHAIREAIKSMRGGIRWDGFCRHGIDNVDEESPLVAEISRRYKAADDAKFEEYRREVESTPIDDEAWQRELEWRTKIEAWEAGENYVHRVGGRNASSKE